MNNTSSLSPAGVSLLGDETIPGESEAERKKRLAALEAQRQKIAGNLSPAGSALAQRGYLTGMLS
jgi:hypothetical protein